MVSEYLVILSKYPIDWHPPIIEPLFCHTDFCTAYEFIGKKAQSLKSPARTETIERYLRPRAAEYATDHLETYSDWSSDYDRYGGSYEAWLSDTDNVDSKSNRNHFFEVSDTELPEEYLISRKEYFINEFYMSCMPGLIAINAEATLQRMFSDGAEQIGKTKFQSNGAARPVAFFRDDREFLSIDHKHRIGYFLTGPMNDAAIAIMRDAKLTDTDDYAVSRLS